MRQPRAKRASAKVRQIELALLIRQLGRPAFRQFVRGAAALGKNLAEFPVRMTAASTRPDA